MFIAKNLLSRDKSHSAYMHRSEVQPIRRNCMVQKTCCGRLRILESKGHIGSGREMGSMKGDMSGGWGMGQMEGLWRF